MFGPLTERLARDDVVALRLPGFGCPRPDGFGASKEEYVDWLTGEVERLGADGPVDLVGHDWGGGFVVRLVSTRPELVRSWVSDAAGVGDERFVWHDVAKVWQTPGAGEEYFAAEMSRTPEERAGVLEMFGVPREIAVRMLTELDETTAECILALYRSATDVGREWGPDFRDIPRPGLVVVPSDDAFLDATSARAGAAQAGAQVAELDGLGHWWMLQDPERAARVLEGFWSGLG